MTMMGGLRWIVAAAAAVVTLLGTDCEGSTGLSYKDKDPVPVIAIKIGPYFNPSETYPYYSLPFCKPDVMEEPRHNLGEILSGDRKVMTDIKVLFRVPYQLPQKLCRKTLSPEDIKRLHEAIDQDYYFEMLVDGLPIWGYIGGIQTPTPDYFLKNRQAFQNMDEIDITAKKFIYTRTIFNIAYNGEHIIQVNVTSSAEYRLDITEIKETEVEFTYQVFWHETNVPYTERVEHLQKSEFLPATFEIHWLSIINSFVLVVLLTVFLAIILMRVLKNDFSRYMASDAEEDDFGEDESGWKLIHGDVFRFPENKILFTAILGAGTHLLCCVVTVLILAVFSIVSAHRKGTISTVVLVLYALTAGTGGYVSAYLYKQMGGTNWVWNAVLTATLLPGPLLGVFSVLNTIAISYGSSAALPFGTIVAVFAVYLLVTCPLTLVGAIIGKRRAKPFDSPCRTTKVPRQIPEAPWYRRPWLQILIAGFLPFSSIYIELFYVVSSIWGYRVYTLYGILGLAWILLLIVTSFITTALVYFQLAIEDHRWWWRSLIYGGSTSFFVMAYSFFYYYNRSAMSGFLQTSFYFGYMAIVAYCFFLVLGTVGFFSSLAFVKSIYGVLKLD